MATLDQLAHKNKFTVSRNVFKTDPENSRLEARADMVEQLAKFIADRQMRTSVDGEAVNLTLQLYVFTEDELKALVEGLDQAKPTQGELHVGNDAS